MLSVRYPHVWHAVGPGFVVAYLLLSTAPGLAADSETRGTLVETIQLQKVVIRGADGNQRRFLIDAQTQFRRGTKADRLIDESLLNAGDSLIIRHEGEVALLVVQHVGWSDYVGTWLDERLEDLQDWSRAELGKDALWSTKAHVVALISIALVGLICGLTSALVVTNRMAFFSDALAHCAFAGVALGWILRFAGAATGDSGILATMVVFGILVGLAIGYVREQTSLSNDTVIGVFFAGAMGLGAVLLSGIGSTGSNFSPEKFVFGDPHGTGGQDLVHLVLLLLVVLFLLAWMYNRLVFASFNPSLARARGFQVRAMNYLFIILLGLIVNICLKTVGALLISALLVVPAACASNLSRNLRQFFWLSVAISTLAGLVGWLLSNYWVPVLGGQPIHLGSGGLIVVIGVMIFFVSMPLARWVKGRRLASRTGF
jgi:zinc transport system permease protein